MQIKQLVSRIPIRRLWLFAALILTGIAYLAWCKWGSQPLKPGSVVLSAQQAPQVAKMETAVTPPVRLVVVKDKATAVAKLGLPASEAMNPKEALLTATAVARNRNGATVTTFVNISTGKTRTDITANKSPWFSLEKGNTVGFETGYGAKGRYVQGDWEHEFAQVKGVYLAGKVSGTFYDSTSDLRAGVRLQKHFDWP